MHAEQIQPDDHKGGERRVDGSDGGADEGAAVEVQVAEDFGRTSLRDHSPRRSLWRSRVKRWFGYTHFLLKGLVKVRTEWRFTPKAFGADDAGLQPQTGAQPGELREVDGGGGDESPAKRLKLGGGVLFSFRWFQ